MTGREEPRHLPWVRIGDSGDALKRSRPDSWTLTAKLREPGAMAVRCNRKGGHLVAVVPPSHESRATMVYTDTGAGHSLDPPTGEPITSRCRCGGGTQWPLDALTLLRLSQRGEKSVPAARVAPPMT